MKYIQEHGILIYQEGDKYQYPVDPMTKLNTTKYIPAQQALRDAKAKEKAKKEAAKANKKKKATKKK